jgi:hypothetical protein
LEFKIDIQIAKQKNRKQKKQKKERISARGPQPTKPAHQRPSPSGRIPVRSYPPEEEVIFLLFPSSHA